MSLSSDNYAQLTLCCMTGGAEFVPSVQKYFCFPAISVISRALWSLFDFFERSFLQPMRLWLAGLSFCVVMVSAVFTWTVITQSIYLSFSAYICCERPELIVSLRCGFWSTSVSIMLCLLSTMKHTAKNITCPFPSAQAFPSLLSIMFFFLFLCRMGFVCLFYVL